ncbi:MAG: hypothetical protein JXR95_15955 [Deltaproteobacteria bacterium]|nr:hypothetical protein [Deltaproteobacteria bacterium]
MEKFKNTPKILNPPGSVYLAFFATASLLFELLVKRVAMYFYQPSHELAEISSGFAVLIPWATFSVYQLQIFSFIITAYASSVMLRCNTGSSFWKVTLGIILFFSVPVLVLSGLLIPTHVGGTALWYYLSTLTFIIMISMSFWFFSLKSSDYIKSFFWIIVIVPGLLIMTGKAAFFEYGSNSNLGHQLFLIGTWMYIYQAIFWPIILWRFRLFSIPVLVASFLIAFLTALWFSIDHSSAAGVFFSAFRITLPLSITGKVLFFLSVWSFFYTALNFLFSVKSRSILLGFGLLMWFFSGVCPYTEEEILPFISAGILIILGLTRLPESVSEKSKLPELKDLEKYTGVKLKKSVLKKFPFQKFITFTGGETETFISINFLCTRKNSVKKFYISTSEIEFREPDWIATSSDLIPLSRYIFSTLPRLSFKKSRGSFSVWDRHFFTDDIMSKDFENFLGFKMSGEVRILWGEGLVYESIDSFGTPDELKDTIRTLTKASRKIKPS